MGVKLVVEVLDHAPLDLTPAERLLLVALAEEAREDTRECWPGIEKLAHRTGLAPESVGKAFRRMAAKGVEVRVAIGEDEKGRPVYACRGHQTIYRIPRFAAGHTSKPGQESAQSTPEARTVVRPSGGESPDGGPESPDGGPESPDGGPALPLSPLSPLMSPHSSASSDAPKPTPATSKPKSKKTPAPDTFAVTASMRAWARSKNITVNLDDETERFLDYHRSKANTFADWLAAWRTWIRNAQNPPWAKGTSGGRAASPASNGSGPSRLPPRDGYNPSKILGKGRS